MKNFIAGILFFMPLLSFAFSYEENALAKCDNLALIQIEVGSQMPDGTVSSSKTFVAEDSNNRLNADVTEVPDLPTYQFVSIDNVAHSITKSFEFTGAGGAFVYRYDGYVCESL